MKEILNYKRRTCNEPVTVTDFNAVQSLVFLYTALLSQNNIILRREEYESNQNYYQMLEKTFAFCIVWSIMSAVDEKGRILLDHFIRGIENIFPSNHTVYDYFVDPKKQDFELWGNKVSNWIPQQALSFQQIFVPTVDTTRTMYILSTLMMQRHQVLLTGNTGLGKTMMVQSLLDKLPETHTYLQINFSSATTSGTTQEIIESSMQKRTKDKMGPQGNKKLLIFIDDFNMPKKSSRESPFQPPLELIRMLLDYEGWYDRKKCSWQHILDSQLVSVMAPPGGGREVISKRTQSRFYVLNHAQPHDSQVVNIFQTILGHKLRDFESDVKEMCLPVVKATIEVYNLVTVKFLPTPSKSHYLFNLRDVAKVIQGVLQVQKTDVESKDSLLRLWVHECMRSFSDRFVKDKDNDESRFVDILSTIMKTSFDCEWSTVMKDTIDAERGPIFVSFINNKQTYDELKSFSALQGCLLERLEDYNSEPKFVPMNLVLFRDAMKHICRIHRILQQDRGNMMLIGVGGSGRHSLARLASYVAQIKVFTIEVTNQYRSSEFREDLRTLFNICGIENKSTVFLFSDSQIKDESFLEDINNFLSSGEVPNLFLKEDLANIFENIRMDATRAGVADTPNTLWKFFVNRVRANLHVILTMSPIGDSLRTRSRMFPALVNCTHTNCFGEWPEKALQEVSMKFLGDVGLGSDDYASLHSQVSDAFAAFHVSATGISEKMKMEQKRFNYITPSNYLEFVKGYLELLKEKQRELGGQKMKLSNGLEKLESGREQVESMSVELETKKKIVAKSQKECEDMLKIIVSERREAESQKKEVEAKSEKIGKEEYECKAIAADAEADLAIALPALEQAMQEVEKLDKNSISEIKGYTKPPPAVEKVLSCVMILLGKPTDWTNAKKTIGETSFLSGLKSFDKGNVKDTIIAKVKKYVTSPSFAAEEISKISKAAGALCFWCHAIYIYAGVSKEVAPKRARLKAAQDSLTVKQAALTEAKDALALIISKVEELKSQYEHSVSEKNRLKQEANDLEDKLNRAEKLINGLGGEYIRWQNSVGILEQSISELIGDVLFASGFLSYAGPFDTAYRELLAHQWRTVIKDLTLPFSKTLNFSHFLSKATDVRDWNIQGLPKDNFSTENGVIVNRCRRWPLLIDPQGQANKWVRNMEGEGLRIIDLKMKDFLRVVETAILNGLPVLLQDILEEIDPSLEPVLSKSTIKVGNRNMIKLGDKEIDYNNGFRLYISTKLSNPHFAPEISTKTTVVNFSVKQQGLEDQLLGIVVNQEEPSLQKEKSALTLRIAAGNKKLVELEDDILKKLAESKGSLLDNIELVNTLQVSKITAEEVAKQLTTAKQTEAKIDAAREGYRPAAIQSSVAYLVLMDMSKVDPMYQYSLDAYSDLFNKSIYESRAACDDKSENTSVSERVQQINRYHTLSVYNWTCVGLFERHKLLFSLQLCFNILKQEKDLPQREFDFFCRGGVVLDRSNQKQNQHDDWINEITWDNINEIENIESFHGLMDSFDKNSGMWKEWFTSSKPEETKLPDNWHEKLNSLQKMCIIRALRPDRLLFAATQFISDNMGSKFAEPPPFNLREIYGSSTCKTPLIFILSPGVDPTEQVQQLAKKMERKFVQVALGQGQGPVAVRAIKEALINGSWVLLANCHLMLSWMSDLEKMVETYSERKGIHQDYRLWLSCSPSRNFPMTLLQRGIKMTTEPPRGLVSKVFCSRCISSILVVTNSSSLFLYLRDSEQI